MRRALGPPNRWIRPIVGFIVTGALVVACAQGIQKNACKGKVTYSFAGVDRKAARTFEDATCAAAATTGAWWGAPFAGHYTVDVSPEYAISRALLPAWLGDRGEMVFPAHRVNETSAAISHEVAHVIAPNQNRFLAEGLAVYVQVIMGANPAFPNFGKMLDQAVKPYADAASFTALDMISTPERLEIKGVIEIKGAYLLAGSFVKYLIDDYGMDKFRALYALTPLRPNTRGHGGKPTRWKKIYAKDLPTLQRDWRARIDRGEKTAVNNVIRRQPPSDVGLLIHPSTGDAG